MEQGKRRVYSDHEIIVKTPEQWAAEAAGASVCPRCGCPFAEDGKCWRCGSKRPRRSNPKVFADNCPHCGSENTYVGSTNGSTRHCYCRDCDGPGWKQVPT